MSSSPSFQMGSNQNLTYSVGFFFLIALSPWLLLQVTSYLELHKNLDFFPALYS